MYKWEYLHANSIYILIGRTFYILVNDVIMTHSTPSLFKYSLHNIMVRDRYKKCVGGKGQAEPIFKDIIVLWIHAWI